MATSFGKSKSKNKNRVVVPEYLQGLINQSVDTASGAMSRLTSLGGENRVAGLTPQQRQAVQLATDRAGGAGGFVPTVQRELKRTAEGVGVNEFLPSGVASTLRGFGDMGKAIPASVRNTLEGAGDVLSGDVISSLTDAAGAALPPQISALLSLVGGGSGEALPGTLENLMQPGAVDAGSTDALRGVLEGEVIPATSREALEGTARGDFLFGGEGFDQAVDAALRRANPEIISMFGSAGAGGATGGLAQAAVGQAAVDAFASQFGQERGRQLDAADRLARLQLAGEGQDINAASILAELGLAEGDQRLGAARTLGDLELGTAGLLGELDLADRDSRTRAAAALGGLSLDEAEQELSAAGLLGDLIGAERGRELSATGLLGDFANAERGRQLSAVQALPEAAMLDVNMLRAAGETVQNQRQRQLDADVDMQTLILQAAMQSLPISALLGQNTSGKQSGFSLSTSS